MVIIGDRLDLEAVNTDNAIVGTNPGPLAVWRSHMLSSLFKTLQEMDREFQNKNVDTSVSESICHNALEMRCTICTLLLMFL